ncbi:MAG: hypothetical protein JST02_14720 [Bacteroidetes bacterium]|nr:hypothetical protein [Bacteroidota bacterium]
MIELILLFLLTRSIGKLAERKGEHPGKWKILTVLSWIAFEIFGLMLGLSLLGNKNLVGLMLFGLFCAFGGYLLIRFILEKKTDVINDDIDNIGSY